MIGNKHKLQVYTIETVNFFFVNIHLK